METQNKISSTGTLITSLIFSLGTIAAYYFAIHSSLNGLAPTFEALRGESSNFTNWVFDNYFIALVILYTLSGIGLVLGSTANTFGKLHRLGFIYTLCSPGIFLIVFLVVMFSVYGQSYAPAT